MIKITNPIQRGFYPDPSICRVGNDYYMVHSTFAYAPGIPVFKSSDLKNWRLIGHVLERKEQLRHLEPIFPRAFMRLSSDIIRDCIM